MTVQELLNIEKVYAAEHKNVQYVYNEVGELVPSNIDEDINFLEKGYIGRHNHIKPDKKKQLEMKGLSDFEMLMLMCFEGFLSYAFKWNSYDERNSPIPEMCEALDNVLEKSPTYDEGSVLYRFCTSDDQVDFQIEDIYEASHYVTTTKDNWGKDTNMYIITPKKENSNARSLYKLHNHGNENQVTFKRGSKFKVTNIEDGQRKIIYMEEV
ncbi:MAG: hypothetical protein J5658_07945 [Prevotella sp.]|nr:hypothetical protein [Prevotella sp.]